MALHPNMTVRDRPRKMHQVFVPINLNHIDAQIIDPKRDQVVYEGPARSYVSNFIHFWRRCLIDSTISRPLIISGSGSVGVNGNQLNTHGTTSLNRRGLLVGSSAAVSTVASTDLEDRIAADITYSAMAYVNYTLDASNKYFDCLRTVTANADGIDINEIALCGRNSATANPHMFVRDALGATVSLDTDEARIFRYRLHFTDLWPPALQFFYHAFTNTSTTVVSIDNNSEAVSFRLANLQFTAAINNYVRGCIIGSSEVATAWNAYALADAYTATDFYAAAQSTGAVVEDAPNAYVETHRDFINISGAAKTVRQYALYGYGGLRSYIFHAGDLPAPVSVGIDEGIRITYKFSIEH